MKEGNQMDKKFVSKIQVKNLVVKSLGKYEVSRVMKGRVASYSSTGYLFEELADGFVAVRYHVSTSSFRTREADMWRRAEKANLIHDVLITAGFEFNGAGYRKVRG
jgi:hypothetical protein